MELAEVYRLRYEGPEDKLRGIIICKDEQNGYQYLFKDQSLEDVDIQDIMLKYDTYENYKAADKQLDVTSNPLVRYSDHIIPNTHIKSSIHAKDGFLLKFYLFGSLYQHVDFEYPYNRPENLSAPLTKTLLARDGFRMLTVFYAIFNNAVEAHVKVKLINNPHSFKIYGIISARTSAIEYPAYSSLLFYKSNAEKIQVGGREDDINIPLSRDIVVVPLRHQLILEFSLHEEDNNVMVEQDNDVMTREDEMVKRFIIFDAAEDGASMDSISCSKGELKVEVTWRSRESPSKAQANELDSAEEWT